MEILDLTMSNSAEDVKKLIAERVASVPLKDVIDYLSKKYYKCEDTVEFLYVTTVSNSNGILYGPGGFGKTEITKDFFEYFKIPVNTIVGYHDMDVEGLLGIPDMKQLLENSEYITAFEKSVFNKPGILLLEEFLDVRASTAAALKDILTEGGLRQGDKFTPSYAGQVFICSNKDPEEISIDYSTSAFYKERFPCNMFVSWNTFDTLDYINLFKIVFKDKYKDLTDEFRLLAGLCSSSSVENKVISPRMAISAGKVLMTSGIKALKFVNELDTSNLREIEKEFRHEKLKEELDISLNHSSKVIYDFVNRTTSLEERLNFRSWLNRIESELDQMKVSDSILDIIVPYRKKVKSAISHIDSLVFSSSDGDYEYDKSLRYGDIRQLVHKVSS